MNAIRQRIERFLGGSEAHCVLIPNEPQLPWTGGGALLPGSFDPLHSGHLGMARVAKRLLGCSVAFELSVQNVDKPALSAQQIEQRAAQFHGDVILWLTSAVTFEQKSALFPAATFIVGADTIVRIADAKYYRGSHLQRDAAIRSIKDAGCRFLVAGRLIKDTHQALGQLRLPAALSDLCCEIAEQDFRDDISSTEIRRKVRSVARGESER